MEELLSRAIGRRLQEARQAAQLKQEDVACEFNSTRQRISSWENGKTLPNLLEFLQILGAYGVTADEILYGRDLTEAARQAVCGACKSANSPLTRV